MPFTRTLAAAAALVLCGNAALAWGDMYMGDGTHQPTARVAVQAYKAPNHCPAGLQPVIIGGEICCGRPNVAGYYVDHSGRAHRPAAKPARHAPRPALVVGEKGVVYR